MQNTPQTIQMDRLLIAILGIALIYTAAKFSQTAREWVEGIPVADVAPLVADKAFRSFKSQLEAGEQLAQVECTGESSSSKISCRGLGKRLHMLTFHAREPMPSLRLTAQGGDGGAVNLVQLSGVSDKLNHSQLSELIEVFENPTR